MPYQKILSCAVIFFLMLFLAGCNNRPLEQFRSASKVELYDVDDMYQDTAQIELNFIKELNSEERDCFGVFLEDSDRSKMAYVFRHAYLKLYFPDGQESCWGITISRGLVILSTDYNSNIKPVTSIFRCVENAGKSEELIKTLENIVVSNDKKTTSLFQAIQHEKVQGSSIKKFY